MTDLGGYDVNAGSCNKYTIVVPGVERGGGWACGGEGNMGTPPSAQFCCEPKTSL